MPEIIAAIAEPAKMLMTAISSAIGKAYEPRHIRKIAEAKAYEINTIGEALRNNTDIPFVYGAVDGVSADLSDYEALTKRAGSRLAYQEIKKQENIESIVDSAYYSLEGNHQLIDGEISREWMMRFLDSAGFISDTDLQILWSKLLAGKVLSPRSYSLRTLECLKNLEVSDAKLFDQVCEIVVENSSILCNASFLTKHGISYDDILRLDECGLVNSSPSNASPDNAGKNEIMMDFGDYVLIDKSNKTEEISILSFPLTEAGRDISRIVNKSMKFEVVIEICKLVKRVVKNEVALRKIISRKGDKVEYADSDIIF